jgi:hypothetical protein
VTATPTPPSDSSLERGQLGLFGVIMPGVAQIALGLIAVGIIYQYVLGRLRPDALANAPALLEGEPDETPDGSNPRP